MLAPTPSYGRSARVRIELRAGEKRFPLAQIGDDRMIFTQPVTLPGTTGEVLAQIDEHQRWWAVTWTASDEPRKIVPAKFHASAQDTLHAV